MKIAAWNAYRLRLRKGEKDIQIYIASHDVIGNVDTWSENARDFTNWIKDTAIYTMGGTRRSRYGRCSGGIASFVKNSVREGISKLNKTYNPDTFFKMD